jgi:protein ImuB
LPASADGPRVVVAAIEQAQRIVALNDAAARLRLKAGMPLADARAMYPSLPVVEADFEADARLLDAIADWCDRYTPLVGLDPPDGLMLDITGCAHLFGGEAALARDLTARLARQGFRARAAVADTVGCASAVARYGDFSQPALLPPRSPAKRWGGVGGGGLSDAVAIIARGETQAAMLPLPVAALRIAPEIADGLGTMGLKLVADLVARPRAPLAARFDELLLRRLDQALGRIDEPITPRLPLPAALAERRFADPIALEADVLGTIEHLAGELARVLERRGEGARLIQVALFRADGAVHRLEIGTGTPLREPTRVRKLFEDRLATLGDACDPGFGYDMVRLSALVTERCDPTQTGLAGGDHAEALAHLIDRLGARFGLRRVTRLVPRDTHIPEFAVAAVPAHAASGAMNPRQAREEQDNPDSLSPGRPIRLFERPEPVKVIDEVPDGPPARFWWRQVQHEVLQTEGPERIAMEWWRDERGNRLTRDYFRVESRNGMRAWLYREGLYGSEIEPPDQPRWFLHGLFA